MSKNIKRVTVVGAGEAAQMFILTVKSSAKFSNQYNFVSIFDDDKKKINSTIDKIKILDNIKNIGKYKDSFDKIVIAIPSASKSDFNRIYDICLKTNKEILTIPSLREILDKSKSITSVRDIDIKDLIERDEISINYNEISKIVSNKTILITGGAGSIGSVILELCLIGKAKKIICIDNSEYNTYSLLNKISNRKLICKVSDIRDIKMMDFYFQKYKPEIVFHAAALKHLNLQENNLRDCLITNFFGTENILKLVKKYSVNNFVLISTDKAVEPSNNMGLSKRMAEFIVYYYADILKTKMSVVRFGNVIGSSGSVLNYFSSLIKSKKNITITDPKVSRFFMSIEEACYLVLHSIINTKKNFQIFITSYVLGKFLRSSIDKIFS